MTELLEELNPVATWLERQGRRGESEASSLPEWLRTRREASRTRLRELGFPTKKHEDWKYTDLRPLLDREFAAPPPPASVEIRPEQVERFTYWESSSARLVFVNGRYREDLSVLRHLPDGVVVTSVADALADRPELLEERFLDDAGSEADGMRALNAAFAEDGAFVHVPRGCQIKGTVHLLFLSTGCETPFVAHPRNLVVVEDGARLDFVERYAGLDNEAVYFTNAVTSLLVGSGATVEHYKIQRESEAACHLGVMLVAQEKDSRVTSTCITVGADLARHDVEVEQLGCGTHSVLNGLYVVDGARHIDNRACVRHSQSHGTSEQFYKGILDDRSTAVFNGKIIAEDGTVGTDAHQTNKNLLLSDDAVIDTRPQLEIYADDLKCSHGATIGQLDSDSLFYLRSRGISAAQARSLLMAAFASDITTRIKIDAIQQRVTEFLSSRMDWSGVSGDKTMTVPDQALAAGSRGGSNERLDVDAIRAQFPILEQQVNRKPLIYLDNAATSQTPEPVVEAIADFYRRDCANIHRGVHTLSVRATDAYESGRRTVQDFLGAASEREIIFLSGTTEGINLVAHTWVRNNLQPGDEILVSRMEHHSNIVPWQILCEETGIVLKVAPITDTGELDLDAFENLLGEKTRFVSLLHVSNALGSVIPIKRVIEMAHDRGARVLIDGAQAVPHVAVDVVDLDCDFYVFSAHKVYGPTGIGALYGKEELLEEMPPYRGGGDMIASVSFEETTYNTLPYKFEAGTPNVAGVVGMAAALNWVREIGIERIADWEEELLSYATVELEKLSGVRIVGTSPHKAAVISFTVEGVHPHDIGTILDQAGVAIRAGHHCAQPVMTWFRIPATARASFACYNTMAEVDALVMAVREVQEMFGNV